MKSKLHFFLISLFLNSIGNNFYYVALPLLVFNISGSAISMGIMGIIEVLPILFFGPLIGSFVDRHNQKNILIITSLLQSLFVLCICMVDFFHLSILWVYLLGGAVAVNVQFFKVTMFSIIPFLFKNLEKGNAKISSINSLSDLIAPFVASLIIARFGISTVFLINSFFSASFMVVTWMFLSLRKRVQPLMKTRGLLADTFEGFKMIKNNRSLLLLIAIIALSNLGDAGLIQLLIFYLSTDFNLSESLISFIIGISGIGAFLGSFSPYFIKNVSVGNRLFWGLMINNIGIFLLLIQNWKMVPVALFITNFGAMLYFIAQSTLVQSLAEENMIGRVNGTVRLLIQITKPISLSLLMLVANEFGGYYGIITSVILTILTTIVLIASKLREFTFKEDIL